MKLTKSLTRIEFAEDLYKMAYFMLERSKELRSPDNNMVWNTDSNVGKFSVGRRSGHTEAVKYVSTRLHGEGYTVQTFGHGQPVTISKMRGIRAHIVIIDAFSTTYDSPRKVEDLHKVIAEFTNYGTVFLLVQ